MAKADVGNNVTLFGQENGFYCGEANAKMTRNGYPNPADRAVFEQDFLRNMIKAHRSHRETDMHDWNSDPQGLQVCLQMLSKETVKWEQCVSTDRDEVQLFVQDCVEKSGFPTPVLTNQGHHWVLVVGWETEIPPGGGAPVLKHMRYFDPEPVGIGADITVAASTWNRSRRFSKVTIDGTWVDKFVAIGQRSQPEKKGGK
jgi:hypothetical protein